MRHSRKRAILAVTLLALLAAPALRAQSAPARGPEASNAPVAVLPASLYNDQANLRESSDSAQATLATDVLRTQLKERLGEQIVPDALVDSLAASAEARAIKGTFLCQVKVACATWVAARAGARWVVLAKVSKTSNLIWLLSAQLIRVSNGDILLDDSTELKGEPGPMVRVGVRIFVDRVVRTIQAGGLTTNFPQGEPPS